MNGEAAQASLCNIYRQYRPLGPIHTGNNIAQFDLYSLVCAGNCVVCKGGIGDRYCTNCQQRRMIGQYTTQLPVQTKLYRPYCAILLPVCIGSTTAPDVTLLITDFY